MASASFRFLGELNDLLPPKRRAASFRLEFQARQSVKHLIESVGVPHTEIGALFANGQQIGPGYLPEDGDEIEVHPLPVNPPGGAEPTFILDNHLGRLAAYLRMLGCDTLYRNNYQDDELAEIAASEDRILLTRDRRLLMRSLVRRGYCLRSLNSRQQLREVTRRYGLQAGGCAFKRCLLCNTPLKPVDKEAVLHRLEPLTRLYYHEFALCPHCDRLYWPGSHYQRMQELIAEVLGGRG
jgi:uncharacterized protein with PIN domain